MKKYLIIAVCLLTLISCDESLHKANPGDTTLDQIETISQDTLYYKIIVDSDRINIYTADGELLYKNCISTYNNDLLNSSTGTFLAVLLLFLILGILLGIAMMN